MAGYTCNCFESGIHRDCAILFRKDAGRDGVGKLICIIDGYGVRTWVIATRKNVQIKIPRAPDVGLRVVNIDDIYVSNMLLGHTRAEVVDRKAQAFVGKQIGLKVAKLRVIHAASHVEAVVGDEFEGIDLSVKSFGIDV